MQQKQQHASSSSSSITTRSRLQLPLLPSQQQQQPQLHRQRQLQLGRGQCSPAAEAAAAGAAPSSTGAQAAVSPVLLPVVTILSGHSQTLLLMWKELYQVTGIRLGEYNCGGGGACKWSACSTGLAGDARPH